MKTAFPKHVTDRLSGYLDQINRLMNDRQAYLRGVLDTLGVEGDVHVDLDAYTFEVPEQEIPAVPELPLPFPLVAGAAENG